MLCHGTQATTDNENIDMKDNEHWLSRVINSLLTYLLTYLLI